VDAPFSEGELAFKNGLKPVDIVVGGDQVVGVVRFGNGGGMFVDVATKTAGVIPEAVGARVGFYIEGWGEGSDVDGHAADRHAVSS